ncbi:MAG: hypothetical protein LBD02_05950 [Christensenellaceae bacterium]|nr:hypothetical protein [Christensenellaceae bacterium]
MKIRTETTYIALTPQGEKTLHIGMYARLIFHDGTYHAGDIEEITEESVTVSRSDGNYTYHIRELQSIAV